MTYLNSCFSNINNNYAAAYNLAATNKTKSTYLAVPNAGQGVTGQTANGMDYLDLSSEGAKLSLTQSMQTIRRTELRVNYFEKCQELGSPQRTDVVFDKYCLNMQGNMLLDTKNGNVSDADLEDQLLSEKINQAIKKAGVRLEKNEKLNLTVNQDGSISVGEGLSDEKRTKIESALNKNGDLGKQMLISQARHLNNEFKASESQQTNPNAAAINRVLTDATLEKNFGLSVNDFEQAAWNEETGDWEGGLPFQCTAKGQEGLAEKIYTDSISLFSGIDNYLYEDNGQSDNFKFELTFYNGKLVRNKDDHPEEMPGIFNDRGDSFESLSKIVGLDEEVSDIETFISALNEKTTKETEDLNRMLSGLLNEVGLGGENRKITFAEDEYGNIVIEGNLQKDKKQELENLINRDEKLVDRIKNHKARLEILRGLSTQETDETGESKLLANSNFNLGTDDFTAAREQLLKNYLNENGVDYDELAKVTDDDGVERVALFDKNGKAKDNSALQGIVGNFWDLEDELIKTFNQKAEKPSLYEKSPARNIEIGGKTSDDEEKPESRALLSMKRGVLSEATDEKPHDFNEDTDNIRSLVAQKVKQYNEEIAKFDENLKITDFSIRIDDKGNMRIENVKTKGDDAKAISQATKFLNQTATSKQEGFAEAVLAQHDDEHGDVEEYKHYMTISSGFGETLQIHSPEADRAAMAEIEGLAASISEDFGSFFRSQGIRDSFEIFWDPEAGMSLDQAFAAGFSGKQVNRMIGLLNERLDSDDPFNDDLFAETIPVEMTDIMKKICELDYAYSKLHDPGLKEQGVKFRINM